MEPLEKLITQRINSLSKRHKDLGLEPPNFIDIQEIFNNSYKDGFVCHYCKTKLIIGTKYPYFCSPSLDHKIPLTDTNYSVKIKTSKENLCVCCHKCNIIKRTMTEESYVLFLNTLLKNLPKYQSDKILNEMFVANLANKITFRQNENRS